MGSRTIEMPERLSGIGSLAKREARHDCEMIAHAAVGRSVRSRAPRFSLAEREDTPQ